MFNEQKLIELIRQRVFHSPQFSQNFQDDCAWIELGGKKSSALVFSTDLLFEDVHFRRKTTSARDLGWKALAVNLSDLASKGAKPLGFSLSWSLPADLEIEWVEEFLGGLDECARQFVCPLIGGDTTRGAQVSLSLSVLGEARTNHRISRQNARAGELLLVTGNLGESALGLSYLEAETNRSGGFESLRAQALRRHRRPVPRLREGEFLVSHGVSAMMDLSDGVFLDVEKFATASGCGFRVEKNQLPVSQELRAAAGPVALDYALYGGEDYELLLSVAPEKFESLKHQWIENFEIPLSPIGQLTPQLQMGWDAETMAQSHRAFEHFRSE